MNTTEPISLPSITKPLGLYMILVDNVDQVYQQLNEIKSKGKRLMEENRKKFTLNKMTEKLDEIMEKYMKDTPQQVGLNLPKLKKVDKNKSDNLNPLPDMKLPKLKKINNEVSV